MDELTESLSRQVNRKIQFSSWLECKMLVKQKVHCYIPFDAELNFQSNGIIGFSVSCTVKKSFIHMTGFSCKLGILSPNID